MQCTETKIRPCDRRIVDNIGRTAIGGKEASFFIYGKLCMIDTECIVNSCCLCLPILCQHPCLKGLNQGFLCLNVRVLQLDVPTEHTHIIRFDMPPVRT